MSMLGNSADIVHLAEQIVGDDQSVTGEINK